MAGNGTEGGGSSLQFMPFILIILIIYFLMIRPQIKRQKDVRKMLSNLKKGDRVVTNGGIYGTIEGFKEKDEIIILKINPNVKIDLQRGAVGRVIKKGD